MPGITFENARQIVLSYLFPRWPVQNGTLVALYHGYENDTDWQVLAGAKEALIDGDDSFQLMDAPAFLVDKSTGALTLLNVISNLDELDAMTPTGG
jgi:hypothetical protein